MLNRKTDIDTVLFDFDGTVINTNNIIIDSWQHTFMTLTGRKAPEEKIKRTFGEPLKTTMQREFPNVPVDEAVAIYRDWQQANCEGRVFLFEGMRELVMRLKEEGYKVGLITSRLTATTHNYLKSFGIDEDFDTVVAFEDAAKPKPDPAPVNLGLERLNSLPEKSIMLGDSMFDILCARNAGVASVLVGWAQAVTEEEKQGPDAPDYIIEKAEDLLEIL